MTATSLDSLSQWFLSNCNGDWEHDRRVSISNLDNPGWTIEIDLSDTQLEGRDFEPVESTAGGADWYRCWVDKSTFHGVAGPLNLEVLLSTFLSWASSPNG